ncbi:unnamed protein product, partial [Prorocentrum cordatum]
MRWPGRLLARRPAAPGAGAAGGARRRGLAVGGEVAAPSASAATGPADPLARQWLHAPCAEALAGTRLRVMHLNALADCLARHAPLLGRGRGFRCDAGALRWDRAGKHKSRRQQQGRTAFGQAVAKRPGSPIGP